MTRWNHSVYSHVVRLSCGHYAGEESWSLPSSGCPELQPNSSSVLILSPIISREKMLAVLCSLLSPTSSGSRWFRSRATVKTGPFLILAPPAEKTWIVLHPWIKHFQPLFDLDFLFVNTFIISFLSPWIGHRLTPKCGLTHTELNCIASFWALNPDSCWISQWKL